MRPISEALCIPAPGEVTARHRVDNRRGKCGIIAAVYGGVCSTVDWVLGRDLSDRGGIRGLSRNVPHVIRSVDAEMIYEAMGVRGRNEGEGGSKERKEQRGGLHYGG